MNTQIENEQEEKDDDNDTNEEENVCRKSRKRIQKKN